MYAIGKRVRVKNLAGYTPGLQQGLSPGGHDYRNVMSFCSSVCTKVVSTKLDLNGNKNGKKKKRNKLQMKL